jgi:hypothetical protein
MNRPKIPWDEWARLTREEKHERLLGSRGILRIAEPSLPEQILEFVGRHWVLTLLLGVALVAAVAAVLLAVSNHY